MDARRIKAIINFNGLCLEHSTVPVLFTMVIPAIDLGVNNGRLVEWFGKLLIMLAGNGSNPYIAVVSLMIGAAILAGLAYLLVRRAPVKE